MQEFLAELEGSILIWIQEYIRKDWLTPVMKFITHLGDAGWVWIALAVILLVRKKTREAGGVMALSMLLNMLITNVVVKRALARTRPYEVIEGLERIIEAQSDFSFPSGHTACSFAGAVVIYMLCEKKYGIPAMVLAVLIALSRLYVGVHFPTDVLGGALVGTGAALFACWMSRRWKLKKKESRENPKS